MINNKALYGDLELIGFPDVLQLMGSISANGILTLTDSFGNNISIFFYQGDVVDAESSDLKGEKAFFEPFSWSEGTFSFEICDVSPEKRIQNSLTGLILQGLRLLDEGKLEKENDNFLSASKLPVLKGQFIDYAEIVDEEIFEKDELIVKEGRYGSWIWVILDGLVQFEKNIYYNNIPVFQVGRGGFIGSISSFSRGDRPRNASVRALSEVQLGVLDAQSLSKQYSAYSDLLKNYFISLDDRLKKITSAYAGLYASGRKKVLTRASLKEMILERFKQDSPGIISSGNAELYIESDGNFLNLGSLSKGSIVGEIPFVEKPKNYNFYISGDREFCMETFEKKVISREFANISDHVKKMVEFTGTSLSAVSWHLALNLKKKDK